MIDCLAPVGYPAGALALKEGVMPYLSPHDVQREAILAVIRYPVIATIAGVDAVAWASTTSPRVLPGDASGFIGGLHRGRLPAVEVFQVDDEWEHQAAGSGTIWTTWAMRAHSSALTKQAAESQCRLILLASLAALRATAYLFEGSEVFETMQHGPLGHNLTVRMKLAHTYDRATYEISDLPPPEPPDMASGTTYDIDITADPAGVVVYNLPAGQALDNVEVHITEAWDGVGAGIIVGKVGDPDAYLPTGAVDMGVGMTTETDTDEEGAVSILVTVAAGTGATTGAARVQITTTRAGA